MLHNVKLEAVILPLFAIKLNGIDVPANSASLGETFCHPSPGVKDFTVTPFPTTSRVAENELISAVFPSTLFYMLMYIFLLQLDNFFHTLELLLLRQHP